MIGGGIFTTIGPGVAKAGPAIIVSFVLAGLASFFAALCYAELGSIVPVAGSAYTYAYATLGELVAWIIGWDLILEYAVSAAPVASAFSGSIQAALASEWHLQTPAWAQTAHWVQRGPWYQPWTVDLAHTTVDPIAAAFVLVLTIVLVVGIRETAYSNNTLRHREDRGVGGLRRRRLPLVSSRQSRPVRAVRTRHNRPSGPAATGSSRPPPWSSSPTSASTPQPRRPRRRATRKSTSRSAFSARLPSAPSSTAASRWCWSAPCRGSTSIRTPRCLAAVAPLHNAFVDAAITVGVIAGTTSVALDLAVRSEPHLLRDGARRMLPPAIAAVDPRFKTPARMTIVTGLVVALLAFVVPLDALARAGEHRHVQRVHHRLRRRDLAALPAP